MYSIKSLILTLFIAITMLTACSPQTPPDGVGANEKPIYLSDYKGKWIVVNYWAVWCEPCLIELPELNELYKSNKDDVMVLAVSFDLLSDRDILGFADSLHLEFPMLRNFDLAKYEINQIPTLPVTFLFSPEGELVKTLHGPQTEDDLLREMDLGSED